jgi:hypothetical protein
MHKANNIKLIEQALVSLPSAVDFVLAAFTGFIAQQVQQPQFGAFAHLNACTFKLYRLFRVFLIWFYGNWMPFVLH